MSAIPRRRTRLERLRERSASDNEKLSREANGSSSRLALSASPLIFAFLEGPRPSHPAGRKERRRSLSLVSHHLLSLVLLGNLYRGLPACRRRRRWLATAFMILLSRFSVCQSTSSHFFQVKFSDKQKHGNASPIRRQKTFTVGVGVWGFPSLLVHVVSNVSSTFLVCFVALAAIFNIFRC